MIATATSRVALRRKKPGCCWFIRSDSLLEVLLDTPAPDREGGLVGPAGPVDRQVREGPVGLGGRLGRAQAADLLGGEAGLGREVAGPLAGLGREGDPLGELGQINPRRSPQRR